jgi:hypothetical protein
MRLVIESIQAVGQQENGAPPVVTLELSKRS